MHGIARRKRRLAQAEAALGGGEPGEAEWFMGDHLGSIRGLTGAGGSAIVDSAYDYSPYGQPLGASAPGAASSLTSYGYTGQWREALTGLQYHRARWLDTGAARWLSVDPVFDFPGNYGHPYAYVGMNPVENTDLSGKVSRLLVAALVISIIIAILSFYIPQINHTRKYYVRKLKWIRRSIIYPRSQKYLVFDGKYLKMYEDQNIPDPEKNLRTFIWRASAGTEKGYLRLPEGVYWFDPTDDRELHLPTDEDYVSWGPFAYELHWDLKTLIDAKSQHREGGFRIHGGLRAYTDGCIEMVDDWGNEDQPNIREFDRVMQNLDQNTVIVYVIYNKDENWWLE